jgi:dTDP-glucose 4,6-dehydratase
MKILLTGGAGFIGSTLVRHVLATNDPVEVVNLDLLTYAGNLENLREVADDPRHTFVHGDICDRPLVDELLAGGGVDAVVNVAAESHVDRSIEDAHPFIRANVQGTQTLLEAAAAAGVGRFVQVSTDEVYGELPWKDPSEPARPGEAFTETTPLDPRSTYSAAKASGDLLALAYHRTHGLDVVVTRCSNNYGPYQFPEKLIPLMTLNALRGEPLPVYGDGLNVRDWIWTEDHCRGIVAALERGRAGEVYNFGGASERTNLQVVRAILELVGRDESLIRFVRDRPGHDRRYAIDHSKAGRELGWEPTVAFEEGLARTVAWYRENTSWWEGVLDGSYRDYVERMYGAGGRHGAGAAEP